MVDLKKKIIKQTVKFSVATSAAVATFPMISLYQEKVRPVLQKKFPETHFSSDLSFLESITPHLIIGSSIMSFIMMYADQLESFAILLIAVFAMLFLNSFDRKCFELFSILKQLIHSIRLINF